MSDTQWIVSEARRILGSYEMAAEALATAPASPQGTNRSLERVTSSESPVDLRPRPGGAAPAPALTIERAVAAERQRVIADGLEAMKMVDLGRGDEITPRQMTGLEAIILLAGRPAILVQDDDFFEPPKKWAVLTQARPAIQDVLKRVGRINVSGSPSFDWLGTGFLAGPGIILTNRHVAIDFAREQAGTWTFRTGMTSRLDFHAEIGADQAPEFQVVDIVGIHEDLDLAVLKIEGTSSGHAHPDPLPIAGAAPSSLFNRQVYVVGHPAWDGRRNDPVPMRRIFSDIYNVKRLQPGELSAGSGPFEICHDCSTLGGNSGSPVVDLEKHHVLALHFGGRFGEKNHAIPLWALRNDPLIKGADLNFQ